MFHGIILSISIIKSKKNSRSNRWLSLLILVFILCGLYYIFPIGLYKFLPHFIGLHLPLMFTVGPLYYFYTSELVGKKVGYKILHFIPLLSVLILMIPFFIKSPEIKATLLHSYNSGHGSLFGRRVFLSSLLHIFIYMIYAFKTLHQYRRTIKDNYSNIDSINLKWLYYFLISGTAIILLFFTLNILPFSFLTGEVMDKIDIVVLFLWIFSLGYRSQFQAAVPKTEKTEDKKSDKPSKNGKKETSLYTDFIYYIESSKIYLQPELTLPILSEKTGIPRNELSQLINENSGGNFYNLINKFRVDRALELLQDSDKTKMTILDIAYEVGFNNKATFNSAFKKFNKCTPSNYKKSKNR